MEEFLNYILARLSEKSTWIAIFSILGSAAGVCFAPEQQEAIITAGMSIVSLALIMHKEHK